MQVQVAGPAAYEDELEIGFSSMTEAFRTYLQEGKIIPLAHGFDHLSSLLKDGPTKSQYLYNRDIDGPHGEREKRSKEFPRDPEYQAATQDVAETVKVSLREYPEWCDQFLGMVKGCCGAQLGLSSSPSSEFPGMDGYEDEDFEGIKTTAQRKTRKAAFGKKPVP
eukprot:TRINITY_DN70873_c0_g1_i1.p1 TRINITY_DN70873_c0_g1~~TRINITY_DN70873_c0_g1_i1.p1  ORF type:complete len:165 (-),score=39.27 TRINITY_DN70873_c0_g1_i1:221-715(-)